MGLECKQQKAWQTAIRTSLAVNHYLIQLHKNKYLPIMSTSVCHSTNPSHDTFSLTKSSFFYICLFDKQATGTEVLPRKREAKHPQILSF